MRTGSSRRWLVIGAIAPLCGIGCAPEAQRYIRFPDLAHPGPAYVQRSDAIQHDPYPLNDIAPEIVGGRPLAYQQPISEAERARMVPARPILTGAAPVPGAAVYAPPIASSPYAVPAVQAPAPLTPVPAPVAMAPPGVAAPVYSSVPPAATFQSPPAQGLAPVVTTPYSAAAQAPPSPYPTQQRPRY
jgi:fused signal recognition particle receptor